MAAPKIRMRPCNPCATLTHRHACSSTQGWSRGPPQRSVGCAHKSSQRPAARSPSTRGGCRQTAGATAMQEQAGAGGIGVRGMGCLVGSCAVQGCCGRALSIRSWGMAPDGRPHCRSRRARAKCTWHHGPAVPSGVQTYLRCPRPLWRKVLRGRPHKHSVLRCEPHGEVAKDLLQPPGL